MEVRYKQFSDTEVEITASSKLRGDFTRVDHIVKPIQLEKIKFLACSVLKRSQVEDAEGVINIYNELKTTFEQDSSVAASFLNTMLKIVGVIDQSNGSMCDVARQDVFQWRVKLIRCLDVAVQRNKVTQMLDHMYKKYDIKLSREQVTSPIVLFQHLIDRGVMMPGEEKDLLKVEAIIKFCKLVG